MTEPKKIAQARSIGLPDLLGGIERPLPPEIKATYRQHRPDIVELSMSDAITHDEDIPFELWSGRTYELTLNQVMALHAECERVLKIAGKHLPT